MNKPNFRKMSAEEFTAYRPRTEDEVAAHEKESEFRAWCKENEEDFQADEARGLYEERQIETGDHFWDRLDENGRAGWIDNMNKD